MSQGTLDAPLVSNQGGKITGNGDVVGVLANGGLLDPKGRILIDGALDQHADGTLDITLAGTQQGIDYDLAEVFGSATILGDILVGLGSPAEGEPVFSPEIGDSFDILIASYMDITGANLILPDLAGGLLWDSSVVQGVRIGTEALRLTVVVPEPSTALLLFLGLFGLASRSDPLVCTD